jgi:hypothetical protein
MHAVVAGKCTYSSRICEAFTTLSATDEQDFVALLVALVKARLYDTLLGYDITKQRLTTSAENRIPSVFPPSLLSDASVSTIRLRVLEDDEHCLFKAFRWNMRQESLNS